MAAAAVAVLVIAIVELLAVLWLWRIYSELRDQIRCVRRLVREATRLVAEPEPELIEGRHAARIRHGRHAASTPVDHVSFAAPELNGAPGPGG